MKLKPKISYSTHVGLSKLSSIFPIKPRGFIILAQGRTGSSLLTELLNSHPDIECKGEIICSKSDHVTDYLLGRTLRSNLGGRIFGFKAKHYQISKCGFPGNGNEFLRFFHSNGFKIIYLHRRNILATALSTIIGIQRKKWRYDNRKETFSAVDIPPEELLKFTEFRKSQNETDHKFLEGIPNFSISYEDALNHLDQVALGQLLTYLELSHFDLKHSARRTHEGNIRDLVSNWDKIRPVLVDAGLKTMVSEIELGGAGNGEKHRA